MFGQLAKGGDHGGKCGVYSDTGGEAEQRGWG